jgi:hypothetical protein
MCAPKKSQLPEHNGCDEDGPRDRRRRVTIDAIRRKEVRTTEKESILPPNSGWLSLNARRHERKGERNVTPSANTFVLKTGFGPSNTNRCQVDVICRCFLQLIPREIGKPVLRHPLDV